MVGAWSRSVYVECMAGRIITVDADAYERLARLKRTGQSFSQVIKEHVPALATTAADLLERLDATTISEETLRHIERVIEERRRHPG